MIPIELQREAEWCLWKKELRPNGSVTKVPYDPKTGKMAKSNDPDTFASYEYAYEVFETEGEYDGMGIRVSKGFAAIDIDHCYEDGTFSDIASALMDAVPSYTEFSPSKHGLRIIFRTDAEYNKQRYYVKNPNNGVEIYITGATERFVTITGNTLVNAPIKTLTADMLTDICSRFMSRKQKSDKLTDEQIIEKASASSKFVALFRGDMTSYNNDHSSADLALCNILAFWTGKDPKQMDSIFRRSGLYRADKWEREDYRSATISKAIADTVEVYDASVARRIWDKLDTLTLNTGDYTVDGTGVWFYTQPRKKNEEPVMTYVTSTPITISAFLENDVHRVELHYIYNNSQRSIVVDREVIANKNKILTLANYGIAVNSESAIYLVRYLAELERLNPTAIPHYRSCSRLGWLGSDFVPYTDTIKFDGESENKALYSAVERVGDFSIWQRHAEEVRKNLYVRLMMDASLASVLIEKVNGLPFVFHLWGKTGGGKTVALMTAMSVWGDPSAGKLVRTMNSTNAAMMSTATFLYSLPFAGDELQTVKEQGQSCDKLVMQITEGIERGRMLYNRNLPTRSWHNAFLFTGEEPCTTESSGGGVHNRVIEIEFSGQLFENGNNTVSIISKNYGHAGKRFVKFVSEQSDIIPKYERIYTEVMESCNTTDKQAGTAALILLADALAVEAGIFRETPLTVDALAPFLKSQDAVSIAKRARDFVTGWIAGNYVHFDVMSNYETYGRKEDDSTFVIKSYLDKVLNDNGYNFDAVKAEWKEAGFLISTPDGRYLKRKGINGAKPYVVEIRLGGDEDAEEG